MFQKVIWEYEGDETAELFTYEEYKDVGLGEFIEGKLAGDKKRKGSYKADSGTIKEKAPFCRKALKHTEKFEDLTEEAKGLAQKMFEFVKGMNG